MAIQHGHCIMCSSYCWLYPFGQHRHNGAKGCTTAAMTWFKTSNIPSNQWDAFRAMNKWEQTYVLSVCMLHVRSCRYLPSFVKRIASGLLTTTTTLSAHQIFAQSIQLFQRYEKWCACAAVPHLNFCESLANGSLTTYQISAQSRRPFPIYGKGGTSARAHVQVYPILVWWDGGWVRTCACADAPHPWPV